MSADRAPLSISRNCTSNPLISAAVIRSAAHSATFGSTSRRNSQIRSTSIELNSTTEYP